MSACIDGKPVFFPDHGSRWVEQDELGLREIVGIDGSFPCSMVLLRENLLVLCVQPPSMLWGSRNPSTGPAGQQSILAGQEACVLP